MFVKLVSHWHAIFLATFLRILSRTFSRHSCECSGNFHVSRTSCELVAKVLNMFKNFMQIFSPKYFARLSRDGRATFVRVSQTCRREILANLQCKIFHDTRRATVLRKHANTLPLSGKKIELNDIRTNVMRHSHDCRATVVGMKMKISYIRGKVVRHSQECCATVARYIFKIRPKFANLSHKFPFNETAT